MRSLVCFNIFQKKTFSQCAFLVGLLACLALSVGFSLNADALSLTDNSGNYFMTGCQVEELGSSFNNGARVITGNFNGNDCFLTSDTAGLNFALSRLEVLLDRQIPKNSLVSFDYTLTVGNVAMTYYGISFRNAITLYDSCLTPYSAVSRPIGNTGTNTKISTQCSVTILTSNDKVSFSSDEQSRIAWIYSNPNTAGAAIAPSVELVISPGSWRQLSNDSLSADDRQWLLQHLPADSSPAQIEQAIVDAQQQAREDERQELDDEASDYQSELEDNPDQQAIETKMSSILAIIQDFVFAIGRPVISTCILPMDFRAYTGAGFYEVDLCHLSPPSGITTVLNVVFIFFVLGLAYSAIRSVISMYKEVIDG